MILDLTNEEARDLIVSASQRAQNLHNGADTHVLKSEMNVAKIYRDAGNRYDKLVAKLVAQFPNNDAGIAVRASNG